MPEVTVVGAGVVGLTTAWALRSAGIRVQIIAAQRPEATTSAAAGAVWFPFQVGPPERVNAWARTTRRWLSWLAGSTPEAGVDVLTFTECGTDASRPWWADAVEDLTFVDRAQPSGAPCAWSFRAPRIEPALHLRWLESLLERPLVVQESQRLEDVPGEVVINCTGIGARRLVPDPALTALMGQTVVAERGALDAGLAYGDERDPGAMLYLIPRRGEVVVGGCAISVSGDRPPPPDPGLRSAILERARRAGFRHGAARADAVGLRPVRATVRVERSGRLVHHYGHGGAGYTLAWGSAQDVVAMVQPANPSPSADRGRGPSP
jgi:D-amino-acid oxidase